MATDGQWHAPDEYPDYAPRLHPLPADPTTPASGWRPDPSGLHEERWFKEDAPTLLVRDNGIGSLEHTAGTERARPAVVSSTPLVPDDDLDHELHGATSAAFPSGAGRSPLEREGATPRSLVARKSHVSGVTKWLRAPLFLALYLVAYVVLGIVVGLLAVSLLSRSHVSSHGADQTTIGFADALGLALVAIALIAAVLAYPSLVTWVWRQLNEPKMTMAFAACSDVDSLPQGADEHGLAVTASDDHSFIVRVGLVNRGRATLEDGSFQFQVPAAQYRIKALDDPSKRHCTELLPRTLEDGDQGGPGAVRHTSAYDSFAPGIPYVFHAKVTAFVAGPCRLAVLLQGRASNGRSHAWYESIDINVSFSLPQG